MRRSITIALAVAFLAAQAPVPAPAQEAPQRLPVFIKAQPLEKPAPKYPAMMADQSREGWVILSFTITAEGKTANIEVLDSSDRAKRFHEAAIEAVSTWRYTPAQVDGKPVEQRNNELPVVFTIRTSGGNPMGGSDITRSRIRRIDNLLAEGKLEEARLVLEEAEGGYRGLNLYEYSHLFARWHLYHRAKGDHWQSLTYVRRALWGGENALGTELYTELLRQRLQLELSFGYVKDAGETGDRLEKARKQPSSAAPLLEVLAKAKERAASGQPFEVQGKLDQSCERDCPEGTAAWRYRPLRRTVVFQGIQGRIDNVEADCDRAISKGTVQDGTAWTIPASWGDCTLTVRGSRGTLLGLVEE